MNKVKSFTIFEEYYDLITLLSDTEQANVLLAIARFMFEDKEIELNERENKVFVNLKRPLIKSKEQSKRRTKQEPNENQKETKQEPKDQPKENTYILSMSNVNNKKFIKPTLEEVKEYCVERKNNINPESFISYYESNGWKVGKNPMKDWKACIRSWETKNYNQKPQEQLPEWFNKNIEKKEDKKSSQELEEMLKEFR